MQPTRKRLLGGVGALAVLVVVAIIAYFAFLKSDAPPPLTLDSVAGTTTTAAAAAGSATSTGATASTGGAAPSTTAAGSSSASLTNLNGAWRITTASQVGYRVVEDLVGGLANVVAVGRTNAVTGTVSIAGTSATAVDATADLTKLTSDSGRRDNQVQGRILDTARFPTATFKLAAPIDFGAIPAVGTEKKSSATGDLTVHGVTKRVAFDVTYSLVSATEFRLLGTVEMVWADYEIPSPTFAGVANVRDNGQMEFLIVATR